MAPREAENRATLQLCGTPTRATPHAHTTLRRGVPPWGSPDRATLLHTLFPFLLFLFFKKEKRGEKEKRGKTRTCVARSEHLEKTDLEGED